jgi:hypothetical protein
MGNKANLGPCQPLECDRRLAVTTVENAKSETNYCYSSTFREMKRRLLGLETPFVISVARKVMDLSFWENYIGIRVRTAIISRCAILLSIAFEFAGRGGPPFGEPQYSQNTKDRARTSFTPCTCTLYTASWYLLFSISCARGRLVETKFARIPSFYDPTVQTSCPEGK